VTNEVLFTHPHVQLLTTNGYTDTYGGCMSAKVYIFSEKYWPFWQIEWDGIIGTAEKIFSADLFSMKKERPDFESYMTSQPRTRRESSSP
jgi:hypothetical protein